MPETALLVRSNVDQNGVANLWPGEAGLPDTISAWAERYFLTEVTTGERSRKEQARDFRLFISFLRNEISSEERLRWTPRVSREFVDYLRSQLHEDGQRRFADRTVNRVLAHLKTFAKWVHSRRPFLDPEHPLEKMKGLAEEGKLELERALTPEERRRMLDAADHLPVLGGRSRDRRRCKDIEFADERPRRKGYRPWRNRAIVYTLIETGMRRAEVTSIDLAGVDIDESHLLITEKGGRQRKCQISKEGLKAIKDYIKEERGGDAEMFPNSPALFLPAETVVSSQGRLSPSLINRLWNEVALSARVTGRPHTRRAMRWGSISSRRRIIPAPPSGSSDTRTPPPPCSTCSLRGKRCRRRWMTGGKDRQTDTYGFWSKKAYKSVPFYVKTIANPFLSHFLIYYL